MDWRDRGRGRVAAESARVDIVGDAGLDTRDQLRMVGDTYPTSTFRCYHDCPERVALQSRDVNKGAKP